MGVAPVKEEVSVGVTLGVSVIVAVASSEDQSVIRRAVEALGLPLASCFANHAI